MNLASSKSGPEIMFVSKYTVGFFMTMLAPLNLEDGDRRGHCSRLKTSRHRGLGRRADGPSRPAETSLREIAVGILTNSATWATEASLKVQCQFQEVARRVSEGGRRPHCMHPSLTRRATTRCRTHAYRPRLAEAPKAKICPQAATTCLDGRLDCNSLLRFRRDLRGAPQSTSRFCAHESEAEPEQETESP
jgi:hypothetical protein